MGKKLRNLLASVVLGLLPLSSIQAQDIKPHAQIEVAYVSNRFNAYDYSNETKGKINAGLELKANRDLSFSLSGSVEAYINPDFSKINYSEVGIEAKADYKNMEIYGSYSLGGDYSALNLKNMLMFGARFKLGDKPNKNSDSLKLNSYGNLDIAYVPFRQQYDEKKANEIKTSITGNVEIDYRNFFMKMGGTERTYENAWNLFSFYMNMQEYETFASAEIGRAHV
jgi:hypothetical protein